MRTVLAAVVTVSLFFAVPPLGRGAEPPADWLKWLPPQATAVLSVDAQLLYKSQLAEKAGWAKRHAAGVPIDITSLSPDVARLLIASDLNLGNLNDTWRAGVVATGLPMTPERIARQVGGRVDTVVGRKAVVTPLNTVFVPVEPTLMVLRQPADRQAISRWLRESQQAGAAGPSAYLSQAVTGAAPIIAAIDATDVIDEADLVRRLDKSKALVGRPDVAALAHTLAGLKGLTLSVTVGADIRADLRLDFAESATALKPVLKDLVIEALNATGAGLDDLANWEVEVEGHAAHLRGTLTETSLKHVLGPFFPPAAGAAASRGGDGPAASPGQDAKQASLAFFTGLTGLLDELRTMKGLNLQTRSYWYNQYSRKIDALPILGVDPDLVQFGSTVSATLRGLAATATQTSAQGQVIESQRAAGTVQTPYTVGSYGSTWYGQPYGFGYTGVTEQAVNNYGAVNTLLAANEISEGKVRVQTWKNINDALADMRKKMTLKYQVEFPAAGEK
jgi:hypothetical protein